MNPSFCVHCGYNFTADEPLEINGWRLGPRQASLNGTPIILSPAEAGVLYAIAKAGGELVCADALLNRVSGTENTNIIGVYVCRLRRKLGAAFPIQTVRRHGYRWSEPMARAA